MEQILLQPEREQQHTQLLEKLRGGVNDFEIRVLYTDDKRDDNRVIDLAKRFNVSENCVIRHLKNLGIFKWRDSLKNPLNKRIVKMYNDGFSQQMIYEQLAKEGYKRVTQANISRRFKKWGIKARSRGITHIDRESSINNPLDPKEINFIAKYLYIKRQWSCGLIARTLRIDRHSVYNRLNKMGIERKRRTIAYKHLTNLPIDRKFFTYIYKTSLTKKEINKKKMVQAIYRYPSEIMPFQSFNEVGVKSLMQKYKPIQIIRFYTRFCKRYGRKGFKNCIFKFKTTSKQSRICPKCNLGTKVEQYAVRS